jgi:membrane associated rhomboid family serine protease
VFLPIGDEPNVRHAPSWVNYGLIASNVVLFLVAQAAGRRPGATYDEVVQAYGYVPASPSFETLFSSMFMHANLLHLFGNMLYLWIFGDNVEARLGPLGYLATYLATGAAATLAFGVANADSATPLVGASGAISGIQGVYFVAFPRNRVKLLIWFYYVTVIHVKARWIIGFWFVVNDILPMVVGRSLLGDQVAHAAHLGGFGAGLAVALAVAPALRNWFPEPPPGRYGTREPGTAKSSPLWGREAFGRFGRGTVLGSGDGVAGRVVEAWRGGRRDEAAEIFARALREGEQVDLPEAEQIRLAVHLYDGGRFDDARNAFEAFLRDHPTSRNAPAAAFGLGMILSRRDGDLGAARPLLETAARQHPDATVRDLARREVERIDTLGA